MMCYNIKTQTFWRTKHSLRQTGMKCTKTVPGQRVGSPSRSLVNKGENKGRHGGTRCHLRGCDASFITSCHGLKLGPPCSE